MGRECRKRFRLVHQDNAVRIFAHFGEGKEPGNAGHRMDVQQVRCMVAVQKSGPLLRQLLVRGLSTGHFGGDQYKLKAIGGNK